MNETKLNPGIEGTVFWLQEHGFDTCDSGDGETHDHACDRETGYVVIKVPKDRLISEADRLLSLLRDAGVQVDAKGPDSNGFGAEFASIQADYDPVSGSAFIQLLDIHDRMVFHK